MWNIKKNGTNELIYKSEIESQMQKNELLVTRVKKRGGISWETGVDIFVVAVVQLLKHVRLFVTDGLQHTRLPCPSPSPGVCSDSYPLSQ